MNTSEFKDFISDITEEVSDLDFINAIIRGEIASVISVKRQEMGMSQKEFAEFMGRSQSLISRWETGKVNFTMDTLVEIAQCLSIIVKNPLFLDAEATCDGVM